MIESIFFNPWIWIVPIILVVSIALGVFLVRRGLRIIANRGEYSIDGEGTLFSSIAPGLVFLVLGVTYFGFILPPYDASFYQTYRITGELTEVQSAFNGDEGTMSQVFISRVDGIDLLIKSNDQRFRTLEVGDDVNLVCGKGFAYFQEPWYDCSFGGVQ